MPRLFLLWIWPAPKDRVLPGTCAMACTISRWPVMGRGAWCSFPPVKCQPLPVSCHAAGWTPVPGSKASKAQTAAGPVAVMEVNCGCASRPGSA
jgi:hypothetical protein